MNKTELQAVVCEKTKYSGAVVDDIVKAVVDEMVACLARGEAVKMTGFGSISVKDCAARKGKNPKTGEPIDIGARKKLTIKPSKALAELLNP